MEKTTPPPNDDTPLTLSAATAAETYAERASQQMEALRLWATQAWRIGLLMVKGAYLTTERKQLFQKLGEDVFFRIQKGEFSNPELDPQVKTIEKLTRKLELEELQIRAVRFGERFRKQRDKNSETGQETGTDHV